MSEDFKPDILKVFFGLPYKASEYIEIHQPSIKEIVDYGEDKFWNFITRFAGNTTSMRLPLWEAGIDWNKISDFELFTMLLNSFTLDETSLFFGDLDFTKFIPIEIPVGVDEETQETKTEIILVHNERPEIQITEEIYNRIVQYMRMMVGYNPKREFAKGKITKQNIIDEEKMNLKIASMKEKKNKLHNSMLLPLLSFALNHSGFKYKKSELIELDIFEFMDSIKRLMNTESVQALMSGMYSGFMDTSKIDFDKDVNFAKDLYQD